MWDWQLALSVLLWFALILGVYLFWEQAWPVLLTLVVFIVLARPDPDLFRRRR